VLTNKAKQIIITKVELVEGINSLLFRSSSVVEQSAVNRSVVGSNPTCGAICYGPLVKRLRHRPFTAVTRVRIPYGSFNNYFIFGNNIFEGNIGL
jgi:hypothetical protein